MKRLFALIVILVLFVTGCGRPTEVRPAPGTNAVTDPVTDPAPEPEPDPTDYEALFRELFDSVRVADENELTFTVANGEATVTAYTGPGGEVHVPGTLGGAPVTAIADGAFAGIDDLETLCLPESVRTFGEGILRGTQLACLRTPLPVGEGQGFLGFLYGATDYLQNNTQALRSLRYLDLIATAEIPDHALFDCNDLVAIRLDDGTHTVGAYAFYACESLRSVNAQGLVRVGEHAFERCASLTRMTFGEGLTGIGFAALQDCDSLIELTVPFIGASREKPGFLAWIFGAEEVAFSAGFYPRELTRIFLAEDVTSLPDYAFYECVSLRRIGLPGRLSSIGARAFSGCTGLREVILPASVRTVGDAAFSGCSHLTAVSCEAGIVFGTNVFLGCPIRQGIGESYD